MQREWLHLLECPLQLIFEGEGPAMLLLLLLALVFHYLVSHLLLLRLLLNPNCSIVARESWPCLLHTLAQLDSRLDI